MAFLRPSPESDEILYQSLISVGRNKNASEVIRAGLRLLEDEEDKVFALKQAIKEGIDSGFVEDFDPDQFLQNLKDLRSSYG